MIEPDDAPASSPLVAADRKQVTHVAKLHDMKELEAMKPFLREAYEYSISTGSS